MPHRPKSKNRLSDVNKRAVMIAKIAINEPEDFAP